jgi:hypothetical protein
MIPHGVDTPQPKAGTWRNFKANRKKKPKYRLIQEERKVFYDRLVQAGDRDGYSPVRPLKNENWWRRRESNPLPSELLTG